MREIADKKCNSQRDYAETTVLIGNALHLLQDFYSHTDWIDGSNLLPSYGWYRNLSGSYEAAKRLALQQSIEFLLWVKKNAGNCDIIDELRTVSPLRP